MHLLEEDLLKQSALSSRLAVSADRTALAAEALRQSGRLRLRVHGESMLPTLWPGDELEIVRCSVQDAHPGDIILAVREGRFFLHRFVARCQPDGFVLRGDSMPAPDPKVPDEALLGRLAVSAGRNLRSQVIGRVLCFCGPARRLALRLHQLHQLRAHQERVRQIQAQSGAANAFDSKFDGV
jgi:hypothetical protein